VQQQEPVVTLTPFLPVAPSSGGAAPTMTSSPAAMRLVHVRSTAGRRYAGYDELLVGTPADRLPRLLRVLRGLSEAS
jgi:hypothetical protein